MGTSAKMIDAAPAAAEARTRLPTPPTRLKRPALFLDLDGVLAPLAPTPDAVVPEPRRTRVLKALAERLGGRVAIVSGRTLSEIDRISEASVGSASGVHGLERRDASGVVTTAPADPGVRQAVEAFHDFARSRPGILVEDKSVSAGLHYRAAPEEGEAALALAGRLAEQTGLTMQPGILVVELKTPGATKGTALREFMTEAPFKGATPIMLGDDLTDEYGFEAARDLGGFGVLVGPDRETAARHGLAGVDAVLSWLEQVEEAE